MNDTHRVHLVHRTGAALLGLVLLAFGIIGLTRSTAWFGQQGEPVMGMSTNGALSVLSLVAAMVLLVAAVRAGRLSSAVSAVVGAAFLLSGLVHLGLLGTSWNVLAFRLPNVVFSLVAGLVLLLLGFYGRVSGGLPPDNPYRRARPRRTHRPHPEEQDRGARMSEEERRMAEAEMAVAEGVATPRQHAMVRRDQAARQAEERERAHRNVRERPDPDSGGAQR